MKESFPDERRRDRVSAGAVGLQRDSRTGQKRRLGFARLPSTAYTHRAHRILYLRGLLGNRRKQVVSHSMHIAAPPPVLKEVNDHFLVQGSRREEPLSVGEGNFNPGPALKPRVCP